MFGRNNDTTTLAEVRKDIGQVFHKTNTLAQNIQDLHHVIYKDSDSIQNRLLNIGNQLKNLEEEVKHHSNKVEQQEKRIEILESQTSKLVSKSESYEKIKTMIVSAIISLIVPLAIIGFMNAGSIVNQPPAVETSI